MNKPGNRITQARALGFLRPGPDPTHGRRGCSKICKAPAQKSSVQRPFQVAQVRLKLQVPEFRLPLPDRTVFINGQRLVPVLDGTRFPIK